MTELIHPRPFPTPAFFDIEYGTHKHGEGGYYYLREEVDEWLKSFTDFLKDVERGNPHHPVLQRFIRNLLYWWLLKDYCIDD